jgi:hypothetical protein
MRLLKETFMGANRPGVRFKKRLKRAKREMERLEAKAAGSTKSTVRKVLAKVEKAADKAVHAVGGAMVAAAEKIRPKGEGKGK